ncbi:hypothetical protein [Empedobacter sp.]|uniref:hypothetical protein n=1 Tax=Empedobacter sp. TaxID=1927715 RepID=UPI002899BFC6|nr:hypothetical protein [Empedobacter sp.]
MGKYQEALDEYYLEDENGKVRVIYAYFGLAIYITNCLEETFSIMLWTNRIFKNKPKTNKEVNEIIDEVENSRKTMGLLIQEIKENYGLTDEHKLQLKNVLDKRNYLIHKYFRLEIQKFYSETGNKEMLKYFSDIIKEAQNLDNELNQYFEHYKLKLGFDERRITELVDKMKSEEMKRDKSNVS